MTHPDKDITPLTRKLLVWDCPNYDCLVISIQRGHFHREAVNLSYDEAREAFKQVEEILKTK